MVIRKGRRGKPAAAGCLFEALEARRLLAVVMWDGGGDGFTLTDPGNWAGDVLPGPQDDAVVDVPGAAQVSLSSGGLAVNSLTMAEDLAMFGGFLDIATQSVFSGETDWSGGTIRGDGWLSVPAGATLNIGGPVDPRLLIENCGTLNWTTGAIESGDPPRFWIRNQAGALITMSGAGARMGAGTLVNHGLLVVAPPPHSVVTLACALFNDSRVVIASGTLRLVGGGRLDGTVFTGTSAVVEFAAGLYEDFGTTVTGPGTARFVGGVHLLYDDLTLEAAATIDFATFQSTGRLVVENYLEWRAGRIGRLLTQEGATLSLPGPLTRELAGPAVNHGEIVHAGGALKMTHDGRLTNAGLYRLVGGPQIIASGPGHEIMNTGAIVKIGPGTTNIQASLHSTGAVNVGAGSINIDGGGTNAGARHVALGAWLVYRSDYTHLSSPTTSGSGSVVFAGGTQIVAGNWAVSAVVKLVSGTLVCEGQFAVMGKMFWIGGDVGGRAGSLTITSTATLVITAGEDRTFSCMIWNSGLVQFNAGSVEFWGGYLVNYSRIVLINGAMRSSPGAGGSIGNYGTLRKLGRSSFEFSNADGPALGNRGTVEVRGGVLNIAGRLPEFQEGILESGTWRVLPASTLLFGERRITGLGSEAEVEICGTLQRMPGLAYLETNLGTLRISMQGTFELTPITGTFRNNGRIEMLMPLTTFRVNGHLILGASSQVLMSNWGGSVWLTRIVASSAMLGGSLRMLFMDGHRPASGGEQFLLVGTRAGQFAEAILPTDVGIEYLPTGARVVRVSSGPLAW